MTYRTCPNTQRLFGRSAPKIVGLTGSAAMGKSRLVKALNWWHIPVFDADAAVHELYRDKDVQAKILAMFPTAESSKKAGAVDRKKLRPLVMGDTAKLQSLERIFHPYVRLQTIKFLQKACRNKSPLVVLDIPLLFEKGAAVPLDAVWVARCTESLQYRRLRKRGLGETVIRDMLGRQLPPAKKARLADETAMTSARKGDAMRQLGGFVAAIKQSPKNQKWFATSRFTMQPCRNGFRICISKKQGV